MGRIMALDVGDKRIGVALSDALHITAQGIETYTRRDEESDMAHFSELALHHGVERIVVGLPLNMNGSEGFAVNKVRDFCRSLENAVDVPIELLDERLSTAEAERVLISADVSRKRRREVIDKLAAVIILQSYLKRL